MKRIRKIGTGAAVTWILLAALTACAAAQDQGQRPFTKPFHSIIPAENRSDSISPDSVSPKLKSEGTALAYSLVATLAPAATIYFAIPGLIIGPSAGYFYAGLSNRAWQGISFRLVGVGGMFVAYGMCGWNCGPGDSEYGMSQIIYATARVITVPTMVNTGVGDGQIGRLDARPLPVSEIAVEEPSEGLPWKRRNKSADNVTAVMLADFLYFEKIDQVSIQRGSKQLQIDPLHELRKKLLIDIHGILQSLP